MTVTLLNFEPSQIHRRQIHRPPCKEPRHQRYRRRKGIRKGIRESTNSPFGSLLTYTPSKCLKSSSTFINFFQRNFSSIQDIFHLFQNNPEILGILWKRIRIFHLKCILIYRKRNVPIKRWYYPRSIISSKVVVIIILVSVKIYYLYFSCEKREGPLENLRVSMKLGYLGKLRTFYR